MSRFLFAAVALVLASASLHAQVRVVVSDVGPGVGGRILQEALKRPHRLIEPDTSWFVLRRGIAERTTLIVLGRTAAIGGKVDGDVIVVGGDLHVRPGAEISGRGVAIGGGVYTSSLSFLGQGAQSFRDNTYDIQRTPEGYSLAYRSLREDASPPLLFPGVYGLRFPTYDRVNGISIPFGPSYTFAGGRAELNAVATYRSDLGKIDPRLSGRFQLTRRLRAELEAERGTLSNDSWIWPHYVNSLSALVLGTDTRNYYRADRGQLTVHRLWEFTQARLEPFVGFRDERSWAVGPTVGETRGPWSAWNKTDILGMWRPNPQFERNDMHSVLAGTTAEWESVDLKMRGSAHVERSVEAYRRTGSVLESLDFSQVTTDLSAGFPTFGEQEYQMDVHWVTTLGDTPPPQRFVYFGGSGTMPFLDLLEQGGDELLLIDQRYAVPFPNIRLGLFGIPTLQLRHRLGSAGLGKLPAFEQMIGAGVMLTIIRGEVLVHPSSGQVRFTAGFTFSR